MIESTKICDCIICDDREPHHSVDPVAIEAQRRLPRPYPTPNVLMRKTRHPLYGTWRSMIQRCTNPRRREWKHYGGRGVAVCERWRKFENFVVDMGDRPPGLTLDRINSDGDYEPGNCRWATMLEQRWNQRAKEPRGNTTCI